jgi:hypothetical protein
MWRVKNRLDIFLGLELSLKCQWENSESTPSSLSLDSDSNFWMDLIRIDPHFMSTTTMTTQRSTAMMKITRKLKTKSKTRKLGKISLERMPRNLYRECETVVRTQYVLRITSPISHLTQTSFTTHSVQYTQYILSVHLKLL